MIVMAMDHVIMASVGVLLSTVAPIAQKVSKPIFMSFSKNALNGVVKSIHNSDIIYSKINEVELKNLNGK